MSHGRVIQVYYAAAAGSHGKVMRIYGAAAYLEFIQARLRISAAAAMSHGRTRRIYDVAAAKSYGKVTQIYGAAAMLTIEQPPWFDDNTGSPYFHNQFVRLLNFVTSCHLNVDFWHVYTISSQGNQGRLDITMATINNIDSGWVNTN